jgi:hypothetical protein
MKISYLTISNLLQHLKSFNIKGRLACKIAYLNLLFRFFDGNRLFFNLNSRNWGDRSGGGFLFYGSLHVIDFFDFHWDRFVLYIFKLLFQLWTNVLIRLHQ